MSSIQSEFRDDLFNHFSLVSHTNTDRYSRFFDWAWRERHSDGYYAVADYFAEMLEELY